MAIVSGDQLLWYIDIISYALTGKFIAGALKYLTYPENRSFSKTFFASHHIWFLPLCLWVRACVRLCLCGFPLFSRLPLTISLSLCTFP